MPAIDKPTLLHDLIIPPHKTVQTFLSVKRILEDSNIVIKHTTTFQETSPKIRISLKNIGTDMIICNFENNSSTTLYLFQHSSPFILEISQKPLPYATASSNLLCQYNSIQKTPSSGSLFIDALKVETSSLPAADLKQLINLVQTFLHIFVFSTNQLKPAKFGCHKIKLENVKPIKQKAYRMSSAQKQDVDNHVNKMLDDKIIRPSSSIWESPVVLVKKKDSIETRFCIDYRKLNLVTLKDSFPLPNMEETLAQLHNTEFYTNIRFKIRLS